MLFVFVIFSVFSFIAISGTPFNPPCTPPFPNSPVPEAWCKTVIAVNPNTSVEVATYGPPFATLITASTNPSIWYQEALFFEFDGSGIVSIIDYLSGDNADNKSIIQNSRTVPLIIRPLSTYGTPTGWWETSMMISPSNFPNQSNIPSPKQNSNIRLDLFGVHTFATLSFNYTNPSSSPLLLPPYFPYYLSCTKNLTDGLPDGWAVVTTSSFSPSWLIFNGAGFNGTWTCSCLVEVEPSAVISKEINKFSDHSTYNPIDVVQNRFTISETILNNFRIESGSIEAPPICGIFLEFETVAWGTWTPPHSPNIIVNNFDGASCGLSAKDDINNILYIATATDIPFFTLGLSAVNLTSGNLQFIGNNWPYPPANFDGVNGLFFSVDFDSSLGLVVGMTEISKYGPFPTIPEAPGLPYGWTVIAIIDPSTGKSIALTNDLSASLLSFPPIVSGLSSLDATNSILYLLSTSPESNPISPHGGTGLSFFLSISLSKSSPSNKVISIPTFGNGFIVCAFVYSSSINALVTIEFNGTNVSNAWYSLPPAIINLYYLNNQTIYTIGTIPRGTVNPGVGIVAISSDERYVYFGAVQGSNDYESATLITVDVVSQAFSLVNAAPDDAYDVYDIFNC